MRLPRSRYRERTLGREDLDAKTMRAYAYTVVMLLNFLAARSVDLRLPPRRRALLTEQLHEVDLVIRRAGR
jgi:hypothetical protein